MRLVLAIPLLAFSLLAVFRAPHGALWKPAVAATEYGHVLALIALLVALPLGWDLYGRWASALSLVAAALFLTPVLRAHAVNPDPHLTAMGAPSLPGHPFRLRRLAGMGIPTVPVRTEGIGGDRRVDLYGTGTATPRPLVVAIHGGSWNSGDRTQLAGAYHWLAARGWAVAAIEYRLAPEHPFPAQLDDVHAALAWLRVRAVELSIDPEHIVLYGRSAGGQLALLAAYTGADVDGVVALYAPNDMVWSWNHPTPRRILDTPKTLGEYLGGPYDRVPDAYVQASPLAHVGPDSPPTLLVHGQRDELVWHEQSERLQAALVEHDVPHVLLSLPWATHGCEVTLSGPSGQLFLYTLERFLGGLPP